MNIRPGRFLSIGIVVSWIALLSLHVARTYSRPEAVELVDLDAPAEAELTQRGVFYRGARIGRIRERLIPLPDGFRAEQEGRFTLNVLGRERTMEVEGSADLASDGKLRSFRFRLATSTGRSIFETTVLGRLDGLNLQMTIRTGDSERVEQRQLTEPIVLPLTLYYSLARQGLEPGQHYRLRLFDPMTLSDGEVEISVIEREVVRWGGREEEAYRLRTSFAGLSTVAWINERGEVLQEETPLGWTLRKEAPGSSLQARANRTEAPDVLLQSAVAAIGFAGPSEELREATLKLNNFPSRFGALSGGRQQLLGDDVVKVRREREPFLGTGALSREERSPAVELVRVIVLLRRQVDGPVVM